MPPTICCCCFFFFFEKDQPLVVLMVRDSIVAHLLEDHDGKRGTRLSIHLY